MNTKLKIFIFSVFIVFSSILISSKVLAIQGDYDYQYQFEYSTPDTYGYQYQYQDPYGYQYQYQDPYGYQYQYQSPVYGYQYEYQYQSPSSDPNSYESPSTYTTPNGGGTYGTPAGSGIPPGGYGCYSSGDCRANDGGEAHCCIGEGNEGSWMCASTGGGPYCYGYQYQYQTPPTYPTPAYPTPDPGGVEPYPYPTPSATPGASCVASTIPSAMTAGSTTPVSITLLNNGGSVWTSPTDFLYLVGGTGANAQWTPLTVGLPGGVAIAPVQTVQFTFNLRAPNSPGTYDIRYQMKRTSTAFGSLCGQSSVQVTNMSGSLAPQQPSCSISAGQSSCNINFTWTTTNPVATSAVTSNTNNSGAASTGFTVASGNNGGPTPFIVPYSGRSFFLYNNSILLDQESVTSSCISGTTWNGNSCVATSGAVNGVCATPPNGSGYPNAGSIPGFRCTQGTATSLSGSGPWTWQCTGSGGGSTASCQANVGTGAVTLIANPTVISPGGSSKLTWNSGAASCIGNTDLAFDTGGAPSGDTMVSPAYTTTYTVTCDGIPASATVTVKNKPFFIEF